jgi:hypothetical protein
MNFKTELGLYHLCKTLKDLNGTKIFEATVISYNQTLAFERGIFKILKKGEMVVFKMIPN